MPDPPICRIVLGAKTPPQILFEKLKLLDSLEAGPDDWFILADPGAMARHSVRTGQPGRAEAPIVLVPLVPAGAGMQPDPADRLLGASVRGSPLP